MLIRAGLNVPLDDEGAILDDYRLTSFLPTLLYLQEQGAKTIVVGHIGRDPETSLESVHRYIHKHIKTEFKQDFFNPDLVAGNIHLLQKELDASQDGSVYLLDNVRRNPGEKSNDAELAERLSAIIDVYINEAFPVSHRKHMSVHALAAQAPTAVAGLVMREEIDNLSMAIRPQGHSVAIISGNKFATKLPLIQQLSANYNRVLVSGALANTLYHLQGYEIGLSLYEPDLDQASQDALRDLMAQDALYVPAIVVCGKGNGEKHIKHITEVSADDYIYDTAPDGLVELEQDIAQADIIVWNGPLGYYEAGYSEGTKRLLELATAGEAQTIIGGGNTVDAVRDLGFQEQVSFLSTGGGAMIEFLTHGTLPALEQLDR